MTQYICIHGHFYQPPRENPWLEAIELQQSAYPYHDWNERISAECYAPNAMSRILDEQGRIVRIVNNYSRISFNFGPSLLHWLESWDPTTYEAVLDADRSSVELFSGHGSAMAQCYNHMIMPLANDRDRRTQVLWGLSDFHHRFERRPEGMWLPETAADLDSLEVLTEHGITFTVLAPDQAGRVRGPDDGDWKDVSGGRVDPKRPYIQKLPSGRSIVIFFYDGPISRGVAFEGLLKDGRRFSSRLKGALDADREGPQLVHIATDGETYGHHHHHGDMALAYALGDIDAAQDVMLTNYGEYLERHPPTHEVEIIEDTSWSCVHGVERWRSNCGCRTGGQEGWTQAWRGPLRDALDWLRDDLAPEWERVAGQLLNDPWAARDDYINVILDRSPASIRRFIQRNARDEARDDQVRILQLMELQRHAMLMYTSCGWFFNELSGIETVQVIAYAGRAIQLAGEVLGGDREREFLERLEAAHSNIPEHENGRQIYTRMVRPAMVDLTKVAAHYAISSVFHPDSDRDRVYCYEVEDRDREQLEAGRTQLAVGRVALRSVITGESSECSYGVLHFGDHNVTAGVRPYQGEEALAMVHDTLMAPFRRAEFPGTLRALDQVFPGATYNVKSLFRDEQRAVLDRILATEVEDAETAYRQLYDRHAPLTRFLGDLDVPMPSVFEMTAEFVLNTSLVRELADADMDPDRVDALLEEATARGVSLDHEGLAFALEGTLDAMVGALAEDPEDLERLRRLENVTGMVERVPFPVNTWAMQNVVWGLRQEVYVAMRKRAAAEKRSDYAAAWVEHFGELARILHVALPEES